MLSKTTLRGIKMHPFFKDLSSEEINTLLSTLSWREATVVSLRAGINCDHPHTLEEIAIKFNVTPERVRQIEAKAVRKLRHPSRTQLLKSYQCYDGEGSDRSALKKRVREEFKSVRGPQSHSSDTANITDPQANPKKEAIEKDQKKVINRIEKLIEILHQQGMSYQEIKYLLVLSPQQLEKIKAMNSIEELLKYAKIINPYQYLAEKADSEDVISALERIAFGAIPQREGTIDDAVKTAMQKLEVKQEIETKQKQKPFVIIGILLLFVMAFIIHPGFFALVLLVGAWFVAVWASEKYHI